MTASRQAAYFVPKNQMLSTSPPTHAAPHQACHRHYAAGILPITWCGTTALFLVGKDLRDETFSDFGGRVERVDDNSPMSTAVREWYEETLGVCMGSKAVRVRMQPHNSLCLRSKTQNGHPYYMYVIEIPFAPHLRNAFHKTLNFLKYRNLHKVYVEKTDVQWVTLDTMLHDLPKRPVFANTIHAHRELLEQVSQRRVSWKVVCTEHAGSHEHGKRRTFPPEAK